MAYCVHCGVRLDDAEPRCPLCGTVPIDPAEPERPPAPRAYPVRTPAQTLATRGRYAIGLLTVLLLVPAALCVLVDAAAEGVTWSVYPAGVLALGFVAVITPLVAKKRRRYWTLCTTACAVAAYLWMVERIATPYASWFLSIALPLVALTALGLSVAIFPRRGGKAARLTTAALLIAEAGLLACAVEGLLAWQGIGGLLTWSQYAMAPCFFGAALLTVIRRNVPLYEELARRLHF